MPPFRLLVVSAGFAAIVAIGLYDLHIHQSEPLSLLSVPLGLTFLLAVALGRGWARPMGTTVAGLLLIHGTGLLFVAMAALRRAMNMRHPPDVASYLGTTGATRLVVGLLLLWCMRQWVIAEWFAQRASRRG